MRAFTLRPISSFKTASYFLVFALCVLPLIIDPVVVISFDELYLQPKLLWIYAVIVPCALLVLWRGRAELHWNDITILLAILSAWSVLASLSVRPFSMALLGASDRGDGLLMHLVYLLLALAGWVWWQKRAETDLRKASYVAALGACLLALTNILQQLHLLGIPGEGAWQGVVATPLGGTQGHRGYLGGTLALVLPLALSGLHRARGRFTTLLMFMSVSLVTWALVGSATRGAWLAGLFGVIAFLWWSRSIRRVWLPLVLGFSLFFLANWTLTASSSKETTSYVRTFGNGAQAITDSSQRGVLWNSALTGIAQKPVLGWGTPALWRVMATRPTKALIAESAGAVGNFQRVQRLSNDPLRAPEFRLLRPEGNWVGFSLSVNKVHNEYLDYALTYGLPAALMVIILLGWAIWSGRTTVPGVSAGLIAYTVYLLTWPEIIRFAPIAWFMMGIALAAGDRRPTMRVRTLNK